MSGRVGTKMTGLLVRQLGPRLFYTSRFGNFADGVSNPGPTAFGLARNWSTLASGVAKEEKPVAQPPVSAAAEDENNNGLGIVSYWGVSPPKVTKEDGSAWRWNCFRVCCPSIYNFMSFFLNFVTI